MTMAALLSNWLYTSAFGVYMLAAFAAAAEHALTRYPVRAAAAPVAADTGFAGRCGGAGLALTVLGAGLHLASVVLRATATGRVPWGNMYEYISAVGLVAVAGWLYVARRYRVRRLAAFVLLPIALLLFVGGNYVYAEAAPLQPALRSYWIVVHVAAAVIASGVFLLSGVVSGLHLWATRPAPSRRAPRLPPPDDLDRIAYRTSTFGFITLTFAIITGAVWAESAWGRFWGWDPKETVAFVSWLAYAMYLHARATAGWRHRRAAWFNVAGMLLVLANLFLVNLVISGLHSYAGTN